MRVAELLADLEGSNPMVMHGDTSSRHRGWQRTEQQPDPEPQGGRLLPLRCGCHSDRFILKSRRRIATFSSIRQRIALLLDVGRVFTRAGVDLLIPTTDVEVGRSPVLVGDLRPRVPATPRPVIELCQDKYRLSRFLRGAAWRRR